ncbi:queuine tRNA-ribosyltransferase [Ferrithrix thermotolerans DSM 19514]|uniref:Queuine tRNA-ribosyltransferase n=1 Tax=Ferrithrix thermotolerans DSM 19514 TaxID=1121881 RepID=A0A1M4SHX5_9ACTN|nr:queuine tRNA-ribosyltransferase [Ferrithrix thermotolerans DSM 19514]
MTTLSGRFEILKESGSYRNGRFLGERHSFLTPVFMPVGTRGSVRLFPHDLLDQIGFEVVLANTYHMMLRPGADVVAKLGGLHRFSGWPNAILTDSGGFQVMSLDANFDLDGVSFRSVYDGAKAYLTPENAVRMQELLGSDIAMVLDVCTMLPASTDQLKEALYLTISWAKRSKAAHNRSDQSLFGIVQGGTDATLRKISIEATCEIGFDGYAIGGLAVGEERSLTLETVQLCCDSLPQDAPRYLMGVGDPYSIVHAVELGVDMFDCVAPSRVARHGVGWTSNGKVSVKQARYVASEEPLDPNCECDTCVRYPMALLNHLFKVDPVTLGVLLTRHNLTFMKTLISWCRKAVEEGNFNDPKRFVETYYS